ncbi:unnamed protein product [Blepharisma stoltei]|uniref:AAA-ATPase-like domain-containing protein n=1 Tax=Blepharisma stoltei TaxID=1481888 RepID=A0AAU9JJW4_9CILI|nr:unnamed protein product [Blepharisma stoltei]
MISLLKFVSYIIKNMPSAEKCLYRDFLQLDDWLETSLNQGYASFQTIKNAFQMIYNNKIHFIDQEFSLCGSPTLTDETSGNLDFIVKIEEILQASGPELRIPIVSCWKAVPVEEKHQLSDEELKFNYFWQTIVILPKNHILIDKSPLENPSELIFLIDSSGNDFRIPENIKSLLKEKINFEDSHIGQFSLGGFFPNAKITDTSFAKQCMYPYESGLWCLFNTVMLISKGNYKFLGSFYRFDMDQSSKVRAILENYSIDLNDPTICVTPRHPISATDNSPETQQSALKVKKNSIISCWNVDFINATSEDAFVDKTHFIKKIIDNLNKLILITRPRRWGKTFNMRMLKAFFHPKYDENGNFANLHAFTGGKDNTDLNNSDLSRCLKIMTLDDGRYRKYFGSKPTILLSFGRIFGYRKNGNPNIQGIRDSIWNAYLKHEYEYRQDLENEVKEWCLKNPHHNIDYTNTSTRMLEWFVDQHNIKISLSLRLFRTYINDSSQIKIEDAIINLAQILYSVHNKPVLVLVDEYDRPINDFINISEERDAAIELRGLLYLLFKDLPEFIDKVIFIGILKIAQDTFLSGMNNVEACTIQNDSLYADCFGFTEVEVTELFRKILDYESEEDFIEQSNIIKTWYNGYNVGKIRIYNPWSITSCLQAISEKSDFPLQPYWINTGSYSILISTFSNLENFNELYEIMKTGYLTLNTKIPEEIHFGDIREIKNNFLAYLLHCGYITPDIDDKMRQTYVIPNKEAKWDFYEYLLTMWINIKTGENKINIYEIAKEFIENLGNCEKLQYLIQNELLWNFEESADRTEADFQTLLGGIARLASINIDNSAWTIYSERPNNFRNKADAIFLPVANLSSTIIIHEYKKFDRLSIENAQVHATNALWQIFVKKYMDIAISLYNTSQDYNYFKSIIVRGIVFYQSDLPKWNILIQELEPFSMEQAININTWFTQGCRILNQLRLCGGDGSEDEIINERKKLGDENLEILIEKLITDYPTLDYLKRKEQKRASSPAEDNYKSKRLSR